MSEIIKKVLKYGGLIFLIGLIMLVCNNLFQDWRKERSEERVKKSIKINFQNNKQEFKKLREDLWKLDMNPVTEIEFLNGDEIMGHLSSHSMTDSILNNSIQFYFSSGNDENETEFEFSLIKNGIAQINYFDTLIETHNWRWGFHGDNKEKEFSKFLEYVGISEEELGSIRSQIRKVDCEAIMVHKDKSISLRYDGYSGYQYEYLFPSETSKLSPKYEKLEEGIYSGLYDSGLFCGWMIVFNK